LVDCVEVVCFQIFWTMNQLSFLDLPFCICTYPYDTYYGCYYRYGLSGGGPLNGEVQTFVRTAFGIDLVQGYGLTETCAGLCIQAPDDHRAGIAGVPIPSVEIKLESTPEVCDKKGNAYLSTDTADVEGNPVFGRGEIVARGPSISCGYYLMEDQTKEVFKEDGWLHTGDIGESRFPEFEL
jgi:long-chain acyl-CoA synthetase